MPDNFCSSSCRYGVTVLPRTLGCRRVPRIPAAAVTNPTKHFPGQACLNSLRMTQRNSIGDIFSIIENFRPRPPALSFPYSPSRSTSPSQTIPIHPNPSQSITSSCSSPLSFRPPSQSSLGEWKSHAPLPTTNRSCMLLLKCNFPRILRWWGTSCGFSILCLALPLMISTNLENFGRAMVG